MRPCECKTLAEGMECKRRCLNMTPQRWWELCSFNCPPERPCNEDDSAAVRAHCDGELIPYVTKQPTKLEKLRHFLRAMWLELRWRLSGGRGPTAEEKAGRRRQCDNCDARDPKRDRCTICECFLERRLWLLILFGKLDCACQGCPKGLWGPVGGCLPKSPCGRKK